MTKKLTKAQQFAREWHHAVRMEEYHEWEQWRDAMHRKPFKARVLWFDLLDGRGAIRGLNGEGTYHILACNIKGKRTWYPETACVFYMRDEIVEVELDIDYGATFCIGLTQGYPDNEKWDSLDKDRLAFKCDENGKAINGLFG